MSRPKSRSLLPPAMAGLALLAACAEGPTTLPVARDASQASAVISTGGPDLFLSPATGTAAAGGRAPVRALAPAANGSSTVFSTIGALPEWPLSIGYQATRTSESGDLIRLDRPGVLTTVDVGLSSWACESGGWSTSDCVTASGATFRHPITLNLYAVDYSGLEPAVGSLMATVTREFDIPFRPSADPSCTGGRFFDDRLGFCANGYNTVVSFDLSAAGIVVPQEFLYGIEYDTQSAGPNPIGTDGPYNSLNFGYQPGGSVLVGEDVRADDLLWEVDPDPLTLYDFGAGAWPYTGAVSFSVSNEGHVSGGGWFESPAGAYNGADGPVRVDGNPDDGWVFNAEPPYVTPADFSTAAASIGTGSLHVAPITNGGGSAEKFILRYVPSAPVLVSDLDEFAIDFLIDPAGSSAAANQFYVNIYTLTPDPLDGSWYDCRFDYVATSGSTTTWTELGADAAATATAVGDRIGGGCPSSYGGMPAGSTLLFISVNLGDTSASDTGVGGYFDRAVLTVAGIPTVWDFETPRTGRASFGFSSRYQKGASIPTGQTQFVFQAGDLRFHSTSYDWLVVNQAGSNAQFKGEGTVNGAGPFKFMLWAGDHDTGDTFRIRIWGESGAGPTVVYDNGSDQVIGGGNIVIHDGKKGK